MSDANGSYSAPNLPAANYTLLVAKAGFRTLRDNIAGMSGGSGNLQVILAIEPAANFAVNVNRNPLLSALGTTTSGSSLKAYSASSQDFIDEVALDSNRMTVVLVHAG